MKAPIIIIIITLVILTTMSQALLSLLDDVDQRVVSLSGPGLHCLAVLTNKLFRHDSR